MSTLGTIVVKMVGDTGGFTSSMQTAEKVASTSGGNIGVSIKSGMDVATVAIGTFIGNMIPQVIDKFKQAFNAAGEWADQLDSLGDTLGTTANQSAAITVALKPFGDAGEEITDQVAKLAKGLTDAKGKLGPTALEMQKLGIQFRDAKGKLLPTYDLLKNISTRVAEMPDGLEKTQVMMDLFGKSGKGMSDAMSAMASGGLDEAMKKAEAFGLAVGDNGVQASIDMHKGITDLQLAAQGLAVSIGSQLIPILLPLVQTLAGLAVEYMPKLRALFDQVGVAIQPFVYFVTNLIQQLNSGGNPWSALTNGLITLLMQLGMAPAQAAGLVNGIKTEIEKISGAFTALANGDTGPIVALVQRYANIFLNWVQNDVIPFIGPKITELSNTISTWITTNTPLITGKLKEWSNAFLNWVNTDVSPYLTTHLSAIWFDVSNWISLQSVLLGIKLQEWAQRFTDWIQMGVLPGLPGKLHAIGEAIGAWIVGAVKDIDTNTQKWSLAFGTWVVRDAVPALIKALPAIGQAINTWMIGLPMALLGAFAALASGIVDGIINAIGGDIKRLNDYLFEVIKGAIVFAAGVLGINIQGVNLPKPKLPGRAAGGPVYAGSAYMVGESGPEPFIPDTNGTILPTGSMGEVHNHISIDGTEIVDIVINRLTGALISARPYTYGAQ